jgi:adenylosuccinate synthase
MDPPAFRRPVSRALVVVDLGFGDAGKGLLTDFLVRQNGASVVVRFNGGAQAGHNVVTPDGRHHTFSQFGSGTFVPGVRTFLSRDVLVHPSALFVEEAKLRSVGVTDALARLRVSADALVITPYHQALGRLREMTRRHARHGSCGIGAGETVAHAAAHPDDALRARDVANEETLRLKVRRIRDYAWVETSRLDCDAVTDEEAATELEILRRLEVLEQWTALAGGLTKLIAADDAWLPRPSESSTVVFEGAHGVLLDEWHGFHPHTTWSTCTSGPALQLLSEQMPDAEVSTIGVLRTHAVRHGAGPLPTESPDVTASSDHNTFNEWQGAVRYGWFDGPLARYALEADGHINMLAVTHLDWLAAIQEWTYCDSYQPELALHSSPVPSIEHQEQLTAQLVSARPVLQRCPASEEAVIGAIERMTGKRVAIGSRGPSAADVFVRPGNGESLSI